MASKFEFDETRDAIGADSLNEKDRKAMLDKFKNAGGKVLTEKELKRSKVLAKQELLKKEQRGSRIPAPSSNEKFDRESNKESLAAMQRKALERQKKQLTGTFAKLIIRIRSFTAGLTPFGGSMAKPRFLSFIGLEVKQALVEFNLLGNDLFLQNRDLGKKIARKLDSRSPVFMEVLERMHQLFDSKEFSQLIEYNQANPSVLIPFNMINEHTKKLYRRLYYLYPYQETLKKAFAAAMEIYRAENKEMNETNPVERKRKRFSKDIKVVFTEAFPKLFTLICRMDEVDYPPFSPYLEKAIGIKQEEKIGNRKLGESSTLASGLQAEDDPVGGDSTETDSEESLEESKEENSILKTKEYLYGMKLMKTIDPPGLRKHHDLKNTYLHIPNNDKALLAFLYFMEFDKEMSFVLTTKKIMLNVEYYEGVKKDYNQILADIYNESRNIIQNFHNYSEACEEWNRLDKQKSSGSNYVEFNNRKEKAKSKVDMEARAIRGSIRNYLEQVTRNLAALIGDMKTEKQIVSNMEDAVQFDSDLEGSKRLNGQPVKQCILEAYCFSLALAQRLTDGDLYGGIVEMTDEEMVASFGKTFPNVAF